MDTLLPFNLFGMTYFWDMTLIILAAVLCMLALTVWLRMNRYSLKIIALVWLGFLMILCIGGWRIEMGESKFRRFVINDLLGVAQSFVSTTERLGHAKITEPPKGNELETNTILQLYRAWCRDIPSVAHIYTIRLRPNATEQFDRILVSPVRSTEDDSDHNPQPDRPSDVQDAIGSDGKNDLKISPFDQFRQIYSEAFSGKPAFDPVPSQGGIFVPQGRYRNPKFVTAAVPLKDANGSVEAILCVDFRANQWNSTSGLFRSVELQIFSLLLSLYLILAWVLVFLYRFISRFAKARDDLIVAKKSAEIAAKAKSDFLANMSHEIRTPMNALIGFTDILVQRVEQSGSPKEREESQGILEIIRKSGRDLLTIVNDILDFSRIEANLLQIESIPLSIKQVIEDVWQANQAEVISKNLDFAVRYKEPIPDLILGDPARLRQILVNLVSNAIKFTDKGSVTIKCEMSETEEEESLIQSRSGRIIPAASSKSPFPKSLLMKIDIVDTGIGIEPDAISQLFKPFAQGEKNSSRQFGGTGLGLSIARRLSQLMDGDITAESTPYVGSTFTLRIHVYLPSEKQLSVLSEKIKRDGSLAPGSGLRYASKIGWVAEDSSGSSASRPSATGSSIQSEDSSSGTLHSEEISTSTRESRPLRNVRILLVEDMLVNQIVISTQLREAGAKVEVAGNGQLGVQKISQDMDDGLYFDVVLMDMQMPVMDGYEATTLLRSQGYTRPIIAITAHALIGDREKTIQAGCDDYIAKPVDRVLLIDTLKKYLK